MARACFKKKRKRGSVINIGNVCTMKESNTVAFYVVISHPSVSKALLKIQIIDVKLSDVIVINLNLYRTGGGDCRYRTTVARAFFVACETLFVKVMLVHGREPHIF